MNYQAASQFPRVDSALVERSRKVQAAVLCDVAGRRGTMNSRVRALNPQFTVCGPAFTVEVRPGDNLMFHVALAVAQPGDVIVVDAASRDTATLAAGTFPVFSSGTNPCGPTKGLAGRLSIPISAGGVAVSPGDLVVGDVDGVVVIPRNDVEAVLQAAEKKLAAERQRIEEIDAGLLISPWLDEALRQAGMPTL